MERDLEIPSDEEVLNALSALGGHTDAMALCQELMRRGYEELDSQLAIQRTAERRLILVARDWTLSTPPVPVAA